MHHVLVLKPTLRNRTAKPYLLPISFPNRELLNRDDYTVEFFVKSFRKRMYIYYLTSVNATMRKSRAKHVFGDATETTRRGTHIVVRLDTGMFSVDGEIGL